HEPNVCLLACVMGSPWMPLSPGSRDDSERKSDRHNDTRDHAATRRPPGPGVAWLYACGNEAIIQVRMRGLFLHGHRRDEIDLIELFEGPAISSRIGFMKRAEGIGTILHPVPEAVQDHHHDQEKN